MKKLLAVAALVLLSAAYVGSYFAMLKTAPIPVAYGSLVVCYDREAIYRIDDTVTRAGYSPLLWLDQTIRPQYWRWEERHPVSLLAPAGSGGRMDGTNCPTAVAGDSQ